MRVVNCFQLRMDSPQFRCRFHKALMRSFMRRWRGKLPKRFGRHYWGIDRTHSDRKVLSWNRRHNASATSAALQEPKP